MLLRDGAVLIRNAADVIEVVGEAPQLPVTPCNEASITPVFEDKGEGLPYSTIAQTDAVEYNEPDQIAASLADVPDLEQPDETAIPADIEPAPRLRATPEQYIAPAQNLTTELANLPTAKPSATLRATAALHSQILDRLSPSPMAEDQLIRDLGRKAGDVAPILVDLELDGRISRAPGGLLSLVN
ncbi:MAG: hypothetical protein JKX69_05005 [Rhodobacteraceae bacterium]|nr:hypothetical protein [Paracoccaceae bacterium]